MCAIDVCFLVSMIWVLYDAALILRARSYSWWWALPAAFSAPTLVLFLLKTRYNRRMCRSAWRDDIIWNMRVIHLPMLAALINTFMVAAWLLCAPLYVVQIAAIDVASPMDLSESEIAAATFAMLRQPSSVLFMISYVLSIAFAVFASALHRRVVIKFIKYAINECDVETGLGTLNNSLLTREQMLEKHKHDAIAVVEQQQPHHYMPREDKLDGNLLQARADHDNDDDNDASDDVGTMYSVSLNTGTTTAMVHEIDYITTEPENVPILPPKKDNKQRTMSRQLAAEAAAAVTTTLRPSGGSTLARQSDTKERYETMRRQSSTTPPPPASPRSSTITQRQMLLAGGGGGGDDTTQPPDRAEESGERLDSPRSARRAQGNGSPRNRSGSTSSLKSKKK
jgi:hypothetical protein